MINNAYETESMSGKREVNLGQLDDSTKLILKTNHLNVVKDGLILMKPLRVMPLG